MSAITNNGSTLSLFDSIRVKIGAEFLQTRDRIALSQCSRSFLELAKEMHRLAVELDLPKNCTDQNLETLLQIHQSFVQINIGRACEISAYGLSMITDHCSGKSLISLEFRKFELLVLDPRFQFTPLYFEELLTSVRAEDLQALDMRETVVLDQINSITFGPALMNCVNLRTLKCSVGRHDQRSFKTLFHQLPRTIQTLDISSKPIAQKILEKVTDEFQFPSLENISIGIDRNFSSEAALNLLQRIPLTQLTALKILPASLT